MAKYRKFPFGYRMEFGKMVIDPDESGWVVYIFEQYMLGESIKRIADVLCGTGIRYDADKLWNKNMVARILQDRRYTGDDRYPPIIDICFFQQVDQKRNKKVVGSKVTQAQKILKKKSDGRITSHLEHEVIYLLNGLAGKPERIEIPSSLAKDNVRAKALQTELEELLGMLPVDETQAIQKLMETTIAMYEAIDPREYETQRLKWLFGGEQIRTELDANLLDQCVSAVTVDSMGKVKIRLKNDQIVERGKVQ